jgi:hypothetical protein
VINQPDNEEEKSSSIIDKMRDSDFVVQEDEGLEAGNPVELDTKARNVPGKNGKSDNRGKSKDKKGEKSARADTS